LFVNNNLKKISKNWQFSGKIARMFDTEDDYGKLSPLQKAKLYADSLPSNFGLKSLPDDKEWHAESYIENLKSQGISSLDSYIRHVRKNGLQEEVVSNSKEFVHDPDLFSNSDNRHFFGDEVSQLGEELKVMDYFIENPGKDLSEDELKLYKEYEITMKHLYHLTAEITSEDLEKREKKLLKELDKVEGKLNTLYNKLTPLTEEEKFIAKNLMHINKWGESVPNEDENKSPYAWERPGAVWYEKAHIVDKPAEVDSDPLNDVGFYLEFYLVPGAGEDVLHWEAVSDDGTRLEIPGNFVASFPMREGVTSEEVHSRITDILRQKENQGYAFSREDEDGNPTGDNEYYDRTSNKFGRINRPRSRERVRAEIPLSDVRVENVIPERPPEPEPERWFYRYTKKSTDQTGRTSERDFYFVYEYDEKTKKIVRYKVDENGQKISNSPKGPVPDAIFTDSPDNNIDNQMRDDGQALKIAELNKFYISTNRYSDIKVLNLHPEKEDDKGKKREGDKKLKKMNIIKGSFELDKRLFPNAMFSPVI
jgi:hypothetical protein